MTDTVAKWITACIIILVIEGFAFWSIGYGDPLGISVTMLLSVVIAGIVAACENDDGSGGYDP